MSAERSGLSHIAAAQRRRRTPGVDQPSGQRRDDRRRQQLHRGNDARRGGPASPEGEHKHHDPHAVLADPEAKERRLDPTQSWTGQGPAQHGKPVRHRCAPVPAPAHEKTLPEVV
jgi:hypothetical protein